MLIWFVCSLNSFKKSKLGKIRFSFNISRLIDRTNVTQLAMSVLNSILFLWRAHAKCVFLALVVPAKIFSRKKEKCHLSSNAFPRFNRSAEQTCLTQTWRVCHNISTISFACWSTSASRRWFSRGIPLRVLQRRRRHFRLNPIVTRPLSKYISYSGTWGSFAQFLWTLRPRDSSPFSSSSFPSLVAPCDENYVSRDVREEHRSYRSSFRRPSSPISRAPFHIILLLPSRLIPSTRAMYPPR
jgi:uncharacterized protein (DUF2384 family)